MKLYVHLEDLRIEETVQDTEKKARINTMSALKSTSIRTELDVRGATVDEAIAMLDKYLDDAYLSHLTNVRIVHGKGTGALRSAVTTHLKKISYVAGFRAGEFRQPPANRLGSAA